MSDYHIQVLGQIKIQKEQFLPLFSFCYSKVLPHTSKREFTIRTTNEKDIYEFSLSHDNLQDFEAIISYMLLYGVFHDFWGTVIDLNEDLEKKFTFENGTILYSTPYLQNFEDQECPFELFKHVIAQKMDMDYFDSPFSELTFSQFKATLVNSDNEQELLDNLCKMSGMSIEHVLEYLSISMGINYLDDETEENTAAAITYDEEDGIIFSIDTLSKEYKEYQNAEFTLEECISPKEVAMIRMKIRSDSELIKEMSLKESYLEGLIPIHHTTEIFNYNHALVDYQNAWVNPCDVCLRRLEKELHDVCGRCSYQCI